MRPVLPWEKKRCYPNEDSRRQSYRKKPEPESTARLASVRRRSDTDPRNWLAPVCAAQARVANIILGTTDSAREPDRRPPPPRLTHRPGSAQKSVIRCTRGWRLAPEETFGFQQMFPSWIR